MMSMIKTKLTSNDIVEIKAAYQAMVDFEKTFKSGQYYKTKTSRPLGLFSVTEEVFDIESANRDAPLGVIVRKLMDKHYAYRTCTGESISSLNRFASIADADSDVYLMAKDIHALELLRHRQLDKPA